MKCAPLWALLLLLPACQMALPEVLHPGASAEPEASVTEATVSTSDAVSETETANAGAATAAETALSEAFVAAADAAQAEEEAETTTPKRGLFAFLKPKAAASPLTDTGIEVVEGSSSENAMTALAPETELAAAEIASGTATDITAETTEVRQAGLGGLFGFLKPKAERTPKAAPMAELQLAALPADAEEVNEPPAAERTGERGAEPEVVAHKPLFGFLKSGPRRETSLSTVAPGEILPFGEVGIFCEVKKRDMGKQVDRFPREGRSVWTLYDTDPGSTGTRTQFITGFADGCPRQITAALVMFGEAGLHEVLRYSKGNDSSWSKADDSYEKIKRKACGVGRKERCPAEKLGALESQLAFVSVYPRFGAEHGWLELLLHDGAMMSEEIR